ncbi:transmembrane protein, putative (macronuclear) [Tetrahymena thermophila SB210]|uniref:Transmembrane protein, putative n=1 Tax=Tetrahymena thermophila (strain SB210) TaxID=312017 RepID=W7X6L3_TETTS|nr:transmembrane protein, putative [Tetrahymena thermophila SB210]EWS72013.1 transmembrane protein, putative [Tetrahymena thermophila SB210]|eukprot:XP_012655443.1 transmembrane protein, putative [Tetrahymena thermophila SB210]
MQRAEKLSYKQIHIRIDISLIIHSFYLIYLTSKILKDSTSQCSNYKIHSIQQDKSKTLTCNKRDFKFFFIKFIFQEYIIIFKIGFIYNFQFIKMIDIQFTKDEMWLSFKKQQIQITKIKQIIRIKKYKFKINLQQNLEQKNFKYNKNIKQNQQKIKNEINILENIKQKNKLLSLRIKIFKLSFIICKQTQLLSNFHLEISRKRFIYMNI